MKHKINMDEYQAEMDRICSLHDEPDPELGYRSIHEWAKKMKTSRDIARMRLMRFEQDGIVERWNDPRGHMKGRTSWFRPKIKKPAEER